MTRRYEFRPEWSSSPGETISDILGRKAISLREFARRMQDSEEDVTDLLCGQKLIDENIALQLENALGVSAQFWLNRESQYQDDCKRLGNARRTAEERAWLSNLPIADMKKFGWIEYTTRGDASKACLDFFGVGSLAEWHARYQRISDAVAFRTSETFTSEPGAVITWLRRGEIVGSGIKCGPWDANLCKALIPTLRKLTRTKNPAIFAPKLVDLCALFGVAVVIVRSPKGCRASGSTRFIAKDKALLQLSFRHRSDDHFWFTFFHEIGHLLLHSQSALFIEEGRHLSSREEDEANIFASETLVAPEHLEEMCSLEKNFRNIVRFAKKIGVSTGIVVGQMQHMNWVSHSELNFLKTRYSWR